MKAIWYEGFGAAADVLVEGELEDPRPAAGEVRVRITASGVNPIDVKRRLGGRGEMTAPRVIPHFDGAGVIDAIGPGVPEDRVGERVWVYEAQWQRDSGTAAELVSLPSELAVPLPEDTSFAEGACLGIPALTAHRSVFSDGEVTGQVVLVTGGAGAVGRYAVQFAKLGGAEVIATVSGDEKADSARAAGATHVVNYRSEDVSERAREITDGRGVDRVVEVEFGGNLESSLAALKIGGSIAAYASQAASEPKVPFYEFLYKSVTVHHVIVFLMPAEAKRRAVADITRWMTEGALGHHLGPSFGLDEAVAAHEAVEGGAFGKVVLEIGSET